MIAPTPDELVMWLEDALAVVVERNIADAKFVWGIDYKPGMEYRMTDENGRYLILDALAALTTARSLAAAVV